MNTNYTLSDFDFELPEELIAQTPAHPRDSARLLVFNRETKEITDAVFSELNDYLPENTTLVLNNTKVEKCRYKFGKIEVFVTETVNDTTVRALVFPGKKFKLGKDVELASGLTATVTAIDAEGLRTLSVSTPLSDSAYDSFRLTPLPPYIAQDESLSDEYQTVYAKDEGSKAAPTAGLHFTDNLLAEIRKEHAIIEATLEVGLGTFAPIKEENLDKVQLHYELYHLSSTSANLLDEAEHITAVGTTSVRILESAKKADGHFKPAQGASTDIFIRPGYEFKAVNSLITNFHLPKSSLLMLLAAHVGYEDMMLLYAHAIKEKYRFYSFGDAMLII